MDNSIDSDSSHSDVADSLIRNVEPSTMVSKQGQGLMVLLVVMGRLIWLIVHKFWAIITSCLLILLLLYWFYGGFVALTILMFGILGVCYNAQDLLLYYPDQPQHSRIYVESPSLFKLPYENIFIKAKDGVLLNMMLIKQAPPLMGTAHTLIFLHGNAGNIGHRLANAYGFFTALRVNVLLVEYRGYGKSKGKPSESGLYLDAQAAMDYITQRTDINQKKLVVFGRSLGGAVAIRLATLPKYSDLVHTLILENTFTSLPDIGRHIFNFKLLHLLPVLCFKNKFRSMLHIEKLSCPTLFLSGQGDTLIPPCMMEKLYQTCSSAFKRMARFPGGSHNETWQCSGYYESINRFLVEVVQNATDKTTEQNTGSFSTNIPFDDGGAFTL